MEVVKQWTRWANTTTNGKILSATIVIASLSFSTKLVTIVKEIIVAASFGTGDAIDAFLIAFLIPSFAIAVIGGSFNAAFIPTYIQVREKEGSIKAQKLFSNVMVWSIGLLVIATLIMILAAPYYLPLIAKGFSVNKLSLTCKLLYVLSPIVVLYGINTIWGAVLKAGERFALVAVSPVITPAVVIVFLSLVGKSLGIMALTLGTACGMAMEVVLLGFVLRRKGVSLWPKWHGLDSHLRQVAGQYLPMMSGAFLLGITWPINQGMAAALGSGSVAALNYGNKLIAFPTGLATTALGTAVIPYFSNMVTIKDWDGIHHTLNRYMRWLFATTIPFTIILILISQPLVSIIFQRGSFSAEDTDLVARIQALFAIQIPFYIAGVFLARLISSFKASNLLMWGAFISLIVNIALNYLFMQWFGVAGIALSTSVVYFVSFCFLSYMLLALLKQSSHGLRR
jgi:putative peptidoglycan lipid II flippase